MRAPSLSCVAASGVRLRFSVTASDMRGNFAAAVEESQIESSQSSKLG
jgi:hypothetical protein